MKERENVLTGEEISSIEDDDASSLDNASGVEVEFTSEGKQNLRNEKRKRSDEMQNDEDEDNDDFAAVTKPKLTWTNKLHNRFLQAIKVLGIDEAHPKQILQLMNVPGLRKENVSSHLQKYRLSLKREQDEIQKTMKNGGSTVVHVASHHVLSPFDPQGGFHNLSDMQAMTVAEQHDIDGLIQENLNGSMNISSPVSAYLLKHVDSNQHDASRQLDSAYPECNNQTGDRVTNNELAGFHQIGGSEQFPLGETDPLNIGDSAQTLFDGSLQEKQHKQQQSVLPEPSQLPTPPQEQKEHEIFGVERREEFKSFTVGKGTSQLLYDDDFDSFW